MNELNKLVKHLMNTGQASRPSQAVQLVRSGRVKIDGEVVDANDIQINPDATITVDDAETDTRGTYTLTCTDIKNAGRKEKCFFRFRGFALVITTYPGTYKLGDSLEITTKRIPSV